MYIVYPVTKFPSIPKTEDLYGFMAINMSHLQCYYKDA